MGLKFTDLKLQPHIPGTNELIQGETLHFLVVEFSKSHYSAERLSWENKYSIEVWRYMDPDSI